MKPAEQQVGEVGPVTLPIATRTWCVRDRPLTRGTARSKKPRPGKFLAVRVVQYCQCSCGREREVERVKSLAHFSTKLLPEQRLGVRLVIDHQHPYSHGTGPPTTWRHGRALRFVAMFPPGWPRP